MGSVKNGPVLTGLLIAVEQSGYFLTQIVIYFQ